MVVAVAYLRVSTEKQEVEAQREAIRRFAEERGFEVLWFEEEEGTSGGVPAFERPVFRELWSFLERNPHVKDLIVFELSRLGRDYDDLKNLMVRLSERGIRLWVVTLPTWNNMIELVKESDNPLMQLLYKLIADIIVNVMSFASAQERILISLRTKAGLRKAKERGKKLGRPPYPFPINEIRQLLRKGYRKKDIWRILKAEGKICRQNKANKKKTCMTYEEFLRKLKQKTNK